MVTWLVGGSALSRERPRHPSPPGARVCPPGLQSEDCGPVFPRALASPVAENGGKDHCNAPDSIPAPVLQIPQEWSP